MPSAWMRTVWVTPRPFAHEPRARLDARLTGEGIREQLPEGFSFHTPSSDLFEIYSMRSATWSGGWVSKNNSFCPMQGQGAKRFS
jgi:hypothetical protein